jgi:hypothetical protein
MARLSQREIENPINTRVEFVIANGGEYVDVDLLDINAAMLVPTYKSTRRTLQPCRPSSRYIISSLRRYEISRRHRPIRNEITRGFMMIFVEV